MNPDDPKFTAFALDELDAAERAEIEQLLRDDPAAMAEVEATRAFATQLRTRLKAERADGLHSVQREEVLAAAAAETPAKVIAFSGRAAMWSALAASVLVGVSWALVFPALNQAQKRRDVAKVPSLKSAVTDGSDVEVRLGNESAHELKETVILPEPPLAQLEPEQRNALPAIAAAPAPSAPRMPSSQPMILKDVALDGLLASESLQMKAKPMSLGVPTRMGGRASAINERAVRQRIASAPPASAYRPMKEESGTIVRTLSKEFDAPGFVPESPGTESYDDVTDNSFLKVTDAPLSTFSIDVDTASYANVRRFLNANTLPPRAAVRIEELVNYFHYDYPQPEGDAPFSTAMEIAGCPWAPEHRLLRVALHGRDIARAARPSSNLIFLIDVSGSMEPENKLPLLKRSLQLMVDQLGERDQVGIVVYAGAAGCVLEPTHSKDKIRAALDRLASGGSTHGSAGLQLAYELATQHFIKGGTNRVILATDGDWNVGVTGKGDLWSMIGQKAKSGVFLTVLGFGMDNLKDDMLEKLADKGNGNYAYIDTLNEGRKVLVDELGATLITIAKDVKIQIEFNPAQVGAYRLIGYENRVMAAKDFADDTKDAGEIGAGHNVTALYEIVPPGVTLPAAPTEVLKYQSAPVAKAEKADARIPNSEVSDELLTLKLRYKAPASDTSTLREFPCKDAHHTFAQSSRDFRFAAAVAGYGMILRESPHRGTTDWPMVHELAVEGKGEDRDGYRAEFVGLVEKARAMMR